MAVKKILLFSDGTGNSSGKAQKTNVWRLFQAVDQSKPDQLAKYDDGVGTSSNKYLAALGGAFGYGLKRNIIDLYKFICRNHQTGDEIYGFGFSRGAFTIRMLVGLIDNQGLVPFRSEEELHTNAILAYRRFRSNRFRSYSPIVWLARRLRDIVLWPFTRTADDQLKSARRGIPIKFLGLWDTVAAYGMPIDELKWGINLLIWPMVTADRKLSKSVERACHALSLDDQRQTFHPILFDESAEPLDAKKRITQVWFAGVHSNIGGGYPEDQLSLVSLDWMVSQMNGTGVRIDAAVLKELAEDRSAYARIYDSRAGLASYYRYAPRTVDMGKDAKGNTIIPLVHGSVVMRMAYGSDAYAPISLPSVFEVLAPDGSLLTMHGFPSSQYAPAARQATMLTDAQTRTKSLSEAIANLNPPGQAAVDPELVRQVSDTVWWRRFAYFGCLFATLLVAAFPIAAVVYSAVAKAVLSSIPWIGTDLVSSIGSFSQSFAAVWRGWTADLFQAIGSVLPAYASAWLDALARQPLQMLTALAVVAIFFSIGAFLAQRIHDRARFAWHRSRRNDYLDWAVTSARSSFLKALALALLAVLLLVTALMRGAERNVSGTVTILAILTAAVVACRWMILQRLRRDTPQIKSGKQALPSTPTLKVARFLRCNAAFVGIYKAFAERLIPLVFAGALVYAGLGVTYQAALRLSSSAGVFCSADSDGVGTAPKEFDTRQLCWASGKKLLANHSYEILLTANHDWRDATIPASPAGLSSMHLVHWLATPMKRSWKGHWFQPIVRVGRVGDDEHLMIPLAADNNVARVRFTAERDSELFLYVNDAIVLLPGKTPSLYMNNTGTASLSVCELSGPAGGDLADMTCSKPGDMK